MQKNDTPDTGSTTRTRAPRQRAKPGAARYAKARTGFEDRAQLWLLARPGRTLKMPADLREVVALGVPCEMCGASVYRDRDAEHRVQWKREPGGHWTAGITVTCPDT